MQYELIRLKTSWELPSFTFTHDQEEALTMSDTIVVMNQGYIQQIGTPEDIYNEPKNAFVADFIGDSNIISSIMVEDKLVNILGANFPCVDTGFRHNKPVDVVIRPEDVNLVKPEEGIIKGVVTSCCLRVFIMKWRLTQTATTGWFIPRACSLSEQKSEFRLTPSISRS